MPSATPRERHDGCPVEVALFISLLLQTLQNVLPYSLLLPHRESDVWQRRFWEHTITDEADFVKHFDYLHYNPIKHGWVECPHQWRYSSFHRYVQKGVYDID